MLLATVLIDALHAALEDRKVAFDRVRRDDLSANAADVFVLRVVNAVMAGDVGIVHQILVPASRVRHDGGFRSDVGADDRKELREGRAFHMPATGLAAALNEREHGTAKTAHAAPSALRRALNAP